MYCYLYGCKLSVFCFLTSPVCKSCIVKHLQSNNESPICNVVVHETQPLLNIRVISSTPSGHEV